MITLGVVRFLLELLSVLLLVTSPLVLAAGLHKLMNSETDNRKRAAMWLAVALVALLEYGYLSVIVVKYVVSHS